ncbi:hypothetical protein GCM10018966_088050 [Streptomyces yanii]
MQQWDAAWRYPSSGQSEGAVSQRGRTVKRLYDGGCPGGNGSKRDLTHGAGARGAH